MLGWILLGAVLGLAVTTIAVFYLDKRVAKEILKEHKIKKAFLKDIVTDGNVTHIKLDGLDENYNEQEIQINADYYDSFEIYEGMTICA